MWSNQPRSQIFDGGASIRSFAQQLRAMKIINVALISGVMLFAILTLFVEMDRDMEGARLPLLLSAAVLTGLGIIVSFVVAGVGLEKALEKLEPSDYRGKLQRIVGVRIVSIAMLEAPGLLWVVFSMLSGERIWLCGAGLIVVLMASQYPNKENLEGLLGAEESTIDAALAQSQD